jgi:hypothetical protein
MPLDWSQLLPLLISAVVGWFLRHKGVGANLLGGGAPAAPAAEAKAKQPEPEDEIRKAFAEGRRRDDERRTRAVIESLRAKGE